MAKPGKHSGARQSFWRRRGTAGGRHIIEGFNHFSRVPAVKAAAPVQYGRCWICDQRKPRTELRFIVIEDDGCGEHECQNRRECYFKTEDNRHASKEACS